jgi:diguanylate cyclase
LAGLDQEQESAEFLARNALSRMAALGIPPTPQNFLVWYGYFANMPAELRKAIDGFADSGRTLDHATSEALHRRFFGQEAEAAEVSRAVATVDTLLNRLVGRIATHDRGAQAYGGALADAENAMGQREIGSILRKLIEETRHIAVLNRDLQSHLKSASSEIEGLRERLVDAQQQAETDALTGIANRKRFDAALLQAMAKSRDIGEPLVLMMVDIDLFKRFNDTHGHQVGDQVLRLVARTLTDCLRGGDTPARYGGEEFAVILPRTTLVHARPIGERIRTTLAARKIVRRNTGEALGGITVSLGAALYRIGESAEALIQRADSALYSAKKQGRNRLVMETDAVA